MRYIGADSGSEDDFLVFVLNDQDFAPIIQRNLAIDTPANDVFLPKCKADMIPGLCFSDDQREILREYAQSFPYFTLGSDCEQTVILIFDRLYLDRILF